MAGNVTQAPPAPGTTTQSFSYDAENKLINFNNGVATYAYDGDGHRVQKTMGSSTTIFVYNAMGKLIAEYSTTATTGSGTKYITADNLGSTRVVTDASGGVISRHDYLPFGEAISTGIGGRTGAMGYEQLDGINQKFTSKERDAESGLDFFLARYFSSAEERFASPDWSATPISVPYARFDDPQTLNLYGYVRNNPLSRADLDGHDDKTKDKLILGTTGAINVTLGTIKVTAAATSTAATGGVAAAFGVGYLALTGVGQIVVGGAQIVGAAKNGSAKEAEDLSEKLNAVTTLSGLGQDKGGSHISKLCQEARRHPVPSRVFLCVPPGRE